MTGFLQRVGEAIRTRHLLRDGERVVVAVSGGVDSMVLLRALHSLAAQHRWQLVVAHFNHRLRGRSSDADERLVRRVAAQAGWPCAVASADVRAVARREGVSIEMAARRLRHEFLARAARAHRCRVVALAHHRDDQVELFFLRLLRGAGMEGLGGMAWTSPSPADARVRLVRPLLDLPKADLIEFARAGRVPFREDASNASLDVLRNRVRHELLPLLRRRYQPALDQVVLRTMDLLAADADWLDSLADDASAKGVTGRIGTTVALTRRLLRRQLLALGVAPDFDLVERLRLNRGRTVSVGSGWLQCDAAGRITSVERVAQPASDVRMVALTRAPRSEDFDGVELAWSFPARLPTGRLGTTVRVEWFDADRVGSPVLLRHWRPGDRFHPIGAPAPAKLQDLFTNAKVPRPFRHRVLVATTATGEIWWVEGLRIGEHFKLTAATRRRLRWTWKRKGPFSESCPASL